MVLSSTTFVVDIYSDWKPLLWLLPLYISRHQLHKQALPKLWQFVFLCFFGANIAFLDMVSGIQTQRFYFPGLTWKSLFAHCKCFWSNLRQLSRGVQSCLCKLVTRSILSYNSKLFKSYIFQHYAILRHLLLHQSPMVRKQNHFAQSSTQIYVLKLAKVIFGNQNHLQCLCQISLLIDNVHSLFVDATV